MKEFEHLPQQASSSTSEGFSSLLPSTEEQAVSSEIKPELIAFIQAAQISGAYNAIDERRRIVISEYLTTGKTLSDLTQLAEVATFHGVSYLIKTGLQRVFEHLPSDLQEVYKSPRTVLRLKTSTLPSEAIRRLSQAKMGKSIAPYFTAERRENISKATTGKPKPPFTKAHKDHMSEAQRRRHERYRKQKQSEEALLNEHIIFPSPSDQS